MIFIRHIKIEEYIKSRSTSCDAHEMAHILEHELKEEEIQIIIRTLELKDKTCGSMTQEVSPCGIPAVPPKT